MLSTIFQYELKHWSKQPSTYIYAAILFLFAMLGMAGTAGAFDPPSTSDGPIRWVNSPAGIYEMISFFNKLLLFLLPTIIGMSIYRDYRSRMHSILYTYPFSKRDYLLGKFLSSFCIVVLIVSTIGLGVIVGTFFPGVNEAKIASFNIAAYLQVYLVYVIPNILLFGALVFVIVLWARNIYAAFIAVVLLILLEGMVAQLLAGLDSQFMAALLDPLGNRAAFYYTRYWTLVEQNERLLPLQGVVIYNRLLWLAIALALLGWGYRRFRFSQIATFPLSSFFRHKNTKNRKSPELSAEFSTAVHSRQKRTDFHYNFSFLNQLKTTWYLSNVDFKYIVKNWSFLSIVVGGSLFVVFALLQMNPQYETRILPVTWVMLKFPVLFFSMIINLLTFLYAGMLVHRSKVAQMDQLLDVTPIANWSLLLSKFIALLKMQALLLSLILIGGMAVQTYNGYYRYEIGHYLFELYGLLFIGHMIWALAAIFIQTLFTNPYLGLFLLILGSMGVGYLPEIGIEHFVFRFNASPAFEYSDLNGYGSYLTPYFIYKFYWAMLGLILLLGALLLWTRGLPHSFRERLLIAKSRFNGRVALVMTLVWVGFLSLGFGIYYEDVILNNSVTSDKEARDWIKIYEENYKKFEDKAQPRIAGIKVDLAIFPEKHTFYATGSYLLVNKSEEVIDTVLIRRGYKENTAYYFDEVDRHFLPQRHKGTKEAQSLPPSGNSNMSVRIISRDSTTKCDILVLEKGLAPGDSLSLFFEITNEPNTLFRVQSEVLDNGTFIWNDIFPRFGYQQLSENESTASPTDSNALKNTYAAHDSDWVAFEATISTSEDQTAIAPGYLQKEWTADGRRFFHYKMDSPIKFVFGFNSGRYEVMLDQWKDIDLEIYYHKSHDYNLDRMMKGLKASLAYCTENFGPYQHQQARIIEFPVTEGSYATTFANSFPFSELRFIADIDEVNNKGIDLPFYITAHEMAHQWWGNQVIPANVAGAKMLTESLSEYVALKVLEKQHGQNKMRQFLKYDLDIYLRGRARDSKEEQPLMFNHGQHYIAYGKGALVFYALSNYLGEELLNQTLKAYVDQVRFQEAPYTTSVELVDALKKVTPDSLQYLIEDLFETITLYDNKVKDVEITPLKNGQYQVDMTLLVNKYQTDGFGEIIDAALPLADYIDVGIFGEEGQELYLRKHKFTQANTTLTIIVDQKPVAAGIDPFHVLIDREVGDNEMQNLKF